VFGWVGNRTNFCTMGAVSDVVNIGAWRRARMWIFAAGVAIIATGALQLAGQIDVGKSIYTGSRLLWLSHLAGGLMFGVGMTLAGGCGSKNLIRLGGGNLRGLVVFAFMAIAAYMTLKGLFAVWRAAVLDPVAVTLPAAQDLPSLLSRVTGIERRTALLALVAVAGGGLVVFALAGRDFRQRDPLLGGLAIGLLVALGWYVTGHVGYVADHPETLQEAFIGTNSGRAESLSFVAPYAYTMELLTYWSDASRIVTFGIALSLGVIGGSAAYALASGRFRLEAFHDVGDLRRHLIGAVLMGAGGITALGCTIGQGISGVSTLSIGSILTTIAIVAGGAATMKYQYWREMSA
jgi:uncharacterized membrane protein YedE/YeeE